jgi:CheY-like chemotaxis protein
MNSKNMILLVDDNLVNLKLFKILLDAAGFDVHTAVDAETVREALQQLRPDLILMDIQLPGTDGLTLTREIKNNPELRDIPVVALTAYAMKGDDERAMASGCVGYITKPIETTTFSATVAGFLQRHHKGPGTSTSHGV